ncbi:glycosyltransferase [Fournierella sp.]|uniref:glycosyltransferase n=1 Tax=Allofournierella sp. TaxID=1940256 RepID=UPI0025C3B454|nr:glycosyltransferase [Fournierella sp.]
MKLLCILDSVEFPLAPTPAIARRAAALLAQQGHTVHFLELYDGETVPPEQPGCGRTLLPFADERMMNRVLEFGNPGGTPVPLRLLKLCAHPAAALAAVRQIALKKPRRIAAAKKAIEALDRQYHFDAAVAVAAPYAGSFALAAADFGGKKASWQMDPYAANHSYSAPGTFEREKELLAALDAVFIAPAMTQYYAPGAPLESYAAKARVLDFPSLVSPPPAPHVQREGGRLRCVFVGSLYPTLRTPHYALELFCALNDPKLELVFVGGGWENYPADLLEPYRKILGDRLIVTGPLPAVRAAEEVAKADVLLSLGNGVDNQVPSKIFEYFAAGRPVLHLAKLKNDPCRPYFNRWPLALTLLESEGAGPEVLARLSAFLAEKGRSRLPFEEAARLFESNTPQAAARCLEETLGG